MNTATPPNLPPMDDEGFLLDPKTWHEQVAVYLAAQDGLILTEAHWELIRLVREFYLTYDLSPAMRPLVTAVKNNLGEKKGNSLYLLSLFPGSPAKRIAQYSGLPKPTHCL